jgi:predicted nucleotidyltransferase component of viral defense system
VIEGEHALLVEAALPVCAQYGLALAGGYAIKAHGLVTRPSDDVDFATGHSAPVEEITEALADAYRHFGFDVHVLRASGRKGYLDVGLPSGAAYRVDVLKEPLNHSPTMMSFVPVLALADAVALKVGALHDRGLIRDVIDVHGAAQVFSEPDLVAMGRAALDDGEFQLENLRDQLDRALMYPDEEFAEYGCDPVQSAQIRAWAQTWAARLNMEIAEARQWSDGE